MKYIPEFCPKCNARVMYRTLCKNCGYHSSNESLQAVWRIGYGSKRGSENIYVKNGAHRNAWQAGYDWKDKQV